MKRRDLIQHLERNGCELLREGGNHSTEILKFQSPRPMARPKVRIWFDREADYLEVIFEQREGFFRPTASDCVMKRVDQDGNVLGFSIQSVSALSLEPLVVTL